MPGETGPNGSEEPKVDGLITSADVPKSFEGNPADTGPQYEPYDVEAARNAVEEHFGTGEPEPADRNDPEVQARIAANPRLGGAARPVDGYGAGYNRRNEYPSQAEREEMRQRKRSAEQRHKVDEAGASGAQVVHAQNPNPETPKPKSRLRRFLHL